MEHNQEYMKKIIETVESKLSICDQKLMRDLTNWANDRSIINLINQLAIQINNEAMVIEKNKNKKDITIIVKENEKFKKILKRIEKSSKKSLERLYK